VEKGLEKLELIEMVLDLYDKGYGDLLKNIGNTRSKKEEKNMRITKTTVSTSFKNI